MKKTVNTSIVLSVALFFPFWAGFGQEFKVEVDYQEHSWKQNIDSILKGFRFYAEDSSGKRRERKLNNIGLSRFDENPEVFCVGWDPRKSHISSNENLVVWPLYYYQHRNKASLMSPCAEFKLTTIHYLASGFKEKKLIPSCRGGRLQDADVMFTIASDLLRLVDEKSSGSAYDIHLNYEYQLLKEMIINSVADSYSDEGYKRKWILWGLEVNEKIKDKTGIGRAAELASIWTEHVWEFYDLRGNAWREKTVLSVNGGATGRFTEGSETLRDDVKRDVGIVTRVILGEHVSKMCVPLLEERIAKLERRRHDSQDLSQCRAYLELTELNNNSDSAGLELIERDEAKLGLIERAIGGLYQVTKPFLKEKSQ